MHNKPINSDSKKRRSFVALLFAAGYGQRSPPDRVHDETCRQELMARKKKTTTRRPIESYEHKHKRRVNNPPVGLVTPGTHPDAGAKKR